MRQMPPPGAYISLLRAAHTLPATLLSNGTSVLSAATGGVAVAVQ
jgi:hypothetical protein